VAKDGLFVPRVALYEETAGAEYVLVSTGDGREKRPVKVKARSLSHAVITDGLSPGDRVVLAPEGESTRPAAVEVPRVDRKTPGP